LDATGKIMFMKTNEVIMKYPLWRRLTLNGLLLALFVCTAATLFAQEREDDRGQTQIFLPLIGGAGSAPTAEEEPVAVTESRTNQIIVGYASEVAAATADHVAQVSALSEAAGVQVAYVRELGADAIVVQLSEWQNLATVSAIAEQMLSLPEVAYAEPDVIMSPALTPNDPNYGNQWHYFAPVAGAYGINLPAAWDRTTGVASVVVAVIDTGITNHTDLAGRTVAGYDFISDSRIGNDGNGRDSDPSDPGDWITSAESASGFFAGCPVGNSSWHGTHVAGTIGAASNNGVGVAGVNWNAKILPVRVLGKCGGYSSDIVDGIRWAAGLSVSGVPANANPARVINMSLGGAGACGTTYQNAITAAVNAGTVVVVAAGNSNANAGNYSPASCTNVITVAATNRNGGRAYYSNYGATVEISAPGGDTSTGSINGILSTLNSGTTTPASANYVYYQGTSMATPHVAGVVSLMLSVNASLTPGQITSLLQSNVTPFPSGSSCTTSNCGSGILNAGLAVAAAQGQLNNPPAAFAKSAPANATSVLGSSQTLSWGASVGATSYEYCFDTSDNSTCNSSWINSSGATAVTVNGLAAGTTYFWQVRATNSNGTTYANSSSWWRFTIQAGSPPGAFNKSSPSNGATGVATNTTIRWGASSGATRYEVCVDTSNNNNCDGSWTSVGTARQATVSGMARRTTYYWQVRAVNANGLTNANNGTWWRYTTR